MRSLLPIRSLKLNSIKINYLSGELHTILSIFITHFLNNVITNWSVLYNIFFNIFCLTNLKIKKELKSKVCTYFKNIHGSPRSMYLSRKTRLQCTRYDISKEIDLPVPGYPTLIGWPYPKHHGKNLELGSWTPTCIYIGGCQITC